MNHSQKASDFVFHFSTDSGDPTQRTGKGSPRITMKGSPRVTTVQET